MAKNMTRKGLALGSAAALVAAGFAGAAPAYAAAITFDASFGTSGATQNGLLGKTFNLAATSDTIASTKFYVTGVAADDLTVTYRDVTALDDADTAYNETTTITDKGTATAPAAVVVLSDWAAAEYAQMLWSVAGTDTTTITITPFLDTVVADGKISTNEYTGPAVTLTFHAADEVTATTTLATPEIGTTDLVASVVLDKNINSAAIPAGSVTVAYTKNGSAIAGQGAVEAEWSADDSAWLATGTAAANIAEGDIYAAQATVDGADAGGNTSSSSATAGTATALAAPAFETSSNVRIEATNAQVKAGAGSITLSSTATAAAEGDIVTFTFTKTSLRSGATLTAGGKTLTSADTSISVEVAADADGKAEITASYAGFATTTAADVVTVGASIVGAAAVIDSTTKTITAVDAVSTKLVDANTLGTDAVRAIAAGGSVSLDLHLVDQFGAAIAAERRFVYTITNASANVEVSVPSSQVTSTGAATVTVTDVSTASSGTFELSVAVQKKDTNGNWAADVAVAVVADFVMGGAAVASLTTTAAMDTDDAALTLQTVDMVDQDGRKLNLSAAPYSGNGFVITGYVKAASGAVVAGQPVTISAAGAGFATGVTTSDVYRTDSITVYTTSTGQYTVNAFSNVAGLVDFTVTSGSASKTTTGYFDDAALTAGSVITIDAPAAVAPGSTLVVKATLADKYGNPVSATKAANSVAIAYDGPGLQVSTPTDFVDGALQFGVLLGSNDSGTATVTISVYTGDDKISVQKTVVVGTVGNTGDLASWTKKLTDSSAKIYAKNIVGEGKVQFFLNGSEIAWVRAADATDPKLREANGSYYLVRTVDLVKGQKNVLEVYVDGVRTTRTAYSY